MVEFLRQAAPAAWYNLLTKFGLYGEQFPERDVIGILVFLCERDAPHYPRRVGDAGSLVTGLALDCFLPGWLEREPENPFVAVFAPQIIEDDAALRACGPALWRTVQTAPPAVRDVLGQALEFWFFERFRGLTAKEIWAMLNLVTPIQETRAYQSIFAEGEAEGEAKVEARGEAKGDAKGKVNNLIRQAIRRFGALPAWAERRIETAPMVQVDAWLDGIFDAASLADLIGPDSGSA